MVIVQFQLQVIYIAITYGFLSGHQEGIQMGGPTEAPDMGEAVGHLQDASRDLVQGIGSSEPSGEAWDNLPHVGRALLEVAHNTAPGIQF